MVGANDSLALGDAGDIGSSCYNFLFHFNSIYGDRRVLSQALSPVKHGICVTAQVTYSGSWPRFYVIKVQNLRTRFINNCTGNSEAIKRRMINENKFLENRKWIKACWQMKQEWGLGEGRNCSPTQFQERYAAELGMDFPGIIWIWGWQVQCEEMRPQIQELY